MNNEVKLNKELIKLVNKCFKINVNKFKFLTKASYGKECICLIYSCEGKKFGIVITDKDAITFCELILGDINSPVVAICENEILPLTFNIRAGMVVAEYNENETKVSVMNCNPEMPNFGNKEYTYNGKIFDADEVLIISKLEGF